MVAQRLAIAVEKGRFPPQFTVGTMERQPHRHCQDVFLGAVRGARRQSAKETTPPTARCAVAVALLVLLAALVGCATSTVLPSAAADSVRREQREQQRLAFQTQLDRRTRLNGLAYPILRSNVDLCGERVESIMGIYFDTASNMPEETRGAAARLFSMSDHWHTVLSVTPGSSADRAGLRGGDVILFIEGKRPPVSRGHRRINLMLDAALAKGVVRMRVLRQGRTLAVSVAPERVCAFPVLLVNDPGLNAYADGYNIYITSGMLRFAQSDLDLQTVIAHELAHNTEGHIDKKIGNTLLGGLIGAVVRVYTGLDATEVGAGLDADAFSKDLEREADYISLYMLERAGVDSSQAATFWRRMAVEQSASIRFARTHPTTAERFVNLETTHREIRAKQRTGVALLPNRR